MRIILICLLLLVLSPCFGQKKFMDYSFSELVAACDLKIKMPRGFYEVPVTENKTHPYQFAIKDSTVAFEVRYYVRPYAFFSPGDTLFYPDRMTYSFFVTSILSISGYVLPNIPEIYIFEKEVIKHDCNADYGLNSNFRPVPAFADYKYCSAFLIKKSKVGELTMFLLFNEFNQEAKVIVGDITGSVDFK